MQMVSILKLSVAAAGVLVSLQSAAQTGSTTPTISSSTQSVFDLAAELYPTMFANGSALGIYQGYVYKYFAGSGIYVGIKDDKIYTLGGMYGNAIKEQGSVGAVLNLLQTTKANVQKPATPATGGSTSSGLDTSGKANLAGGSGITFAANGVTRTYKVGEKPVSTSSTGFLVSFQSEATSSSQDASIYVPNKIGTYKCGAGTAAATNNGYFTTNQTAWIAFTGNQFGGTPLDTFGGSCTIEVLSVSPKLEGVFVAQLFGALAGNGKVTAGYFSAPNVATVSTATAGTGTGSLVITGRNSSVPANRVGTLRMTEVGLAKVNGACEISAKGTYAGSSDVYSLKLTRPVGGGQVTGWEFGSTDGSFFAGASNVTTKSIEFSTATKTVRISDTFGTSNTANSIKIEGSMTFTNVGDVTGC